MKNLILALNRANLSDSDIESVLTDFEIWIESRVTRSEQKMMTESIIPIQKENDGIRSEIRLLSETMKHGFAIMEERFQKMDQKWEERFQRIDQKSEERFLRMDQKLEFTRKNLEMQISSTHQQIASTRENLETQIKANDKQLNLVQKLLWLVLTLVLGLFAKAVHLF